MPNQPKTPTITFRCPAQLREAAERIAADRGQTTMTEYLIALIERGVRDHPLDG